MNIDDFVTQVIQDKGLRDEVVCQLVTNSYIMVYYHCYYIVDKASQQRPDLFYPYWNLIAALLGHSNSYHRDIALTIVANLIPVDTQNLFSGIFEDYIRHINDEKFMTGHCCLRNLIKITRFKPEIRDHVLDILLSIDQRCDYPEKQKELLKYDVLEMVDGLYAGMAEKEREKIARFIRTAAGSISPKTRKKAKELVAKFNIR